MYFTIDAISNKVNDLVILTVHSNFYAQIYLLTLLSSGA